MKRNILIGKIGKAVNFKNIKIETGGGNDVMLFSTMSRMHPEWNFYFVGPNGLNKLDEETKNKLFPNKNVFSVFEIDASKWEGRFDKIIENLKSIGEIDCAIFMSGMASQVNVPGLLKKKDGSDYSILNSYLSYVGPYIHVLNKTGVPFFCIAEDARYITINGRDLYNRERLILTQYNGIVEAYKHMVNANDIWTMRPTRHEAVYADIEKIPMMGINPDWKEHINIERKVNSDVSKHFIVLSNGCGTTKINHAGNNSSRLPVYQKWVHEATKGTPYEGAIVYGRWDDDIYEKYPWIQNKKIVEMLDDEIADARYSLVYSQVRGFVTAKAYELITLGIIPFIHPDYDPDRLLGLPEYLYVKTPQDMIAKMKRMDENADGYRKVIHQLMDLIQPSWLDGSLVVNGIFNKIKENLGWEEDVNAEGVTNIFNHFATDIIK